MVDFRRAIHFPSFPGMFCALPPFPEKHQTSRISWTRVGDVPSLSPPPPPQNSNIMLENKPPHTRQVQTEAWQSTRVRVSIDDCSPLTAVIASFGAEPVPSRHDFLAHATLDTDGNGTCGVDVISRPSFIRDGFWYVLRSGVFNFFISLYHFLA